MNIPIDINQVFLNSSRLVIRPWKSSDLTDFYEYAKVKGVGEMAGWPAHQSIEESQRILNSFIQHHKTFALELKSNHKVIGSLGIEAYQITLNEELEQKKGRELGYVLNKEYWGQGLMPEAVKAVIDYCFTELKLDFLICAHFKRNHQSQRVIEKCGFKFLKTANYQTLLKTIEESNYYLLLKEDYFRRSN